MNEYYLLIDCKTCLELTEDEAEPVKLLVQQLACILKDNCKQSTKASLWLSYDNNQTAFGSTGIPDDVVELLKQNHEHVVHILQDATAIANQIASNKSKRQILSVCPDIAKQDGSLADFGIIVAEIASERRIDTGALTVSSIETFFDRMVNPASGFYIQQSDGKYSNSYRHLTLNDIKNHLAGSITIGFPAVDENGYCRWICIDEDNILPPGAVSHLDKLEKYFEERGYYTFREGTRPEANGLKQGHLWIFLARPILAKYARAWIFKATDELGLGSNNTELKKNKLELFPKQDNAANLANPVRGPLGRHVKAGGIRGYFWGVPYKVNEQLEWFANQLLNSPEQIEKEGEALWRLQESKLRIIKNRIESNSKVLSINGKLEFASIYKILNPVAIEGQDYCVCNCPKCGQRRAYFYKNTGQIKCNRIHNCGYELSINTLKKMLNKKRIA